MLPAAWLAHIVQVLPVKIWLGHEALFQQCLSRKSLEEQFFFAQVAKLKFLRVSQRALKEKTHGHHQPDNYCRAKEEQPDWLGALADRVGISRQALKGRVERLEYKGHIVGYTIITAHNDDQPE